MAAIRWMTVVGRRSFAPLRCAIFAGKRVETPAQLAGVSHHYSTKARESAAPSSSSSDVEPTVMYSSVLRAGSENLNSALKARFCHTYMLMERAIPIILTHGNIMLLVSDDVELDDRIWGYSLRSWMMGAVSFSGRQQLYLHIQKVRMYLRWKSPQAGIKKREAFINAADGSLIVHWDFTTTVGMGAAYHSKSFLNTEKVQGREQPTVEGVAHFHAKIDENVSTHAQIYKIILTKSTKAERDAIEAYRVKQYEEMRREEYEMFDGRKYL